MGKAFLTFLHWYFPQLSTSQQQKQIQLLENLYNNTVARWMVRDGSSPGDSYEVLITAPVCTRRKRVFSTVHITTSLHFHRCVVLVLHISFHHH